MAALLFLMMFRSSDRAAGMSRLVPIFALTMITLPGPLAASGAGNGALSTAFGPSAMHLIEAAKVAASLGTVTSTLRSVAHNRRVGGVPNSYHLAGRAIDVQRRPGVTHQMVHHALLRAGFVLIESLDERDHSHFAFASATPTSTGDTDASSSPTEAPGKPPAPRVAADNHGVLLAQSPQLAIAGEPLRK